MVIYKLKAKYEWQNCTTSEFGGDIKKLALNRLRFRGSLMVRNQEEMICF